MLGRLVYAGLTCAMLTSPLRAQDSRAKEDFEKKIRPLFATHCLECHGTDPAKIKSKLRLTSRADLLKGGERGPAIVPGDPATSRLIQAVRHQGDLKMPPTGRLKDSEISDLQAWVKSGAVWPDAKAAKSDPRKRGQLFTDEQKRFWAFQPMRDHSTPQVRNAGWVRSPIDAFILAKLEEKGLRPTKPADKYTLLRRVTFDLTGLPPTPAEIEDFIRDESPAAFEKVVDRLLASPACGERWGRHWLDIARYADSNGLDENTAFGNAWRYRDYVIKSFNEDKPYHLFLREQIAGDLLPDADENPDRLTATGFLVLGPKLLAEPDKQKMKMDIADEQLDTLGKAVLGLTLGCARCHDHKFDPIPQRDYYSLLSIFTSTRTMKNLATVAQAFERPLPTGEKPEEAAARARKIDAKQDEIKTLTDELRSKVLSDARASVAAYLLAVADAKGRAGVARMSSRSGVRGAIVLEAERYKAGTADKVDTGYGEGIGVILSYDPTHTRAEYTVSIPKGGEYELELRYAALESRPVKVSVDGKPVLPQAAKQTTGGWNPEHQAWKPEGRVRFVEGKNTLAIEAHGLLPHIDKLAILPTEPTVAAATGRPSAGTPDDVARERKLIVEFITGWSDYLRQLDRDDPLFAPWLAVTDLPDKDFESAAAARFSKFRDKAPAGLLEPGPKSLTDLAARYAKLLSETDAGKKVLADPDGPFALGTRLPANPELHYPAEFARISKANSELVAIQKAAPVPVMVLSVQDGASYPQVKGDGWPRNLFVHIRGNYSSAGEEAPPIFPRILTGEDAKPFAATADDAAGPAPNQIRYGGSRMSSGRLELARWMTDPKHPLTARVLVNRVWQHHFGDGLVRSPDNFGQLGDRPTHPELLDWLAVRFIQDGWSMKKLHRLLVLSSCYQQSSATHDSGRRTQDSVDPDNKLLWHFPRRRLEAEPIRDALFAVAGNLDSRMGGTLLNNGNFTYVNNENSTNTARYDNHRRSVYLPVIRNTVYDFFQVFDFAEPHVPNGKRASTVVAPQALYLMNSPMVREQSRAFADSLLSDPCDDFARVKLAYLRAYGRPATDEEVVQVQDYIARYEEAVSATEKDASKRRPRAWQSFCQVLYSSSEFIYVN
jgi:mono/diheme cytochrome c family protein